MQIREFDYKQLPIVLLADDDNMENVLGAEWHNNLLLKHHPRRKTISDHPTLGAGQAVRGVAGGGGGGERLLALGWNLATSKEWSHPSTHPPTFPCITGQRRAMDEPR